MISESKFQMWRGTIALTQVDNIISKEEKEWLDKHLKKLPFSPEQKSILEQDYEKKITIDEGFLSKLEPREKGMLLSFANTIFKSDGLSKEEQALLNELTERIMGDLNIEEVKQASKNIEVSIQDENSGSFFQKIINLIT